MKARRIVLVLAVLAVFLGSAPAVAGSATAFATSTGTAAERSSSETTTRPDAPKLAALAVGLPARIASSGSSRRFADGGSKPRALCSTSPCVTASAGSAGIEVEGGARLLRASNTPCCVRGPPTAA